MESNSVDAIVTDPPYGWRFMGKAWDGADIERMAKSTFSETKPSDVGRKKGMVRTPQSAANAAAGTYDLSATGNQAFQLWTTEWAREAFRVLKPGGHMLVFCGPRTYHRMAIGVEDAGFEVRDQLQWLFGSGFPKSLDVSKAIDKAAGAEREVVGRANRAYADYPQSGGLTNDSTPVIFDSELKGANLITAPATDAAKRWQGWGTALKPANEPIVLARKPLEWGLTVAENVLKWGTGALNIDGTRIGPHDPDLNRLSRANKKPLSRDSQVFETSEESISQQTQGRWPANVLFDEKAALELDRSAGDNVSRFFKVCGHGNIAEGVTFVGKRAVSKGASLSTDGFGNSTTAPYLLTTTSITKTATHSIMTFQILSAFTRTCIGLCTIVSEKTIDSLTESNIESVSVVSSTRALINLVDGEQVPITGIVSLALLRSSENGERKIETIGTLTTENTEGALRFAYVAKASKRERNAGLEGMPEKESTKQFMVGMTDCVHSDGVARKNAPIKNQNHHPTVKPIKLMEYLINLACPPGGVVLDPFMGSGSTGVAALKLGFDFVGVEKDPDYLKIAEGRIRYTAEKCKDEPYQLELSE